MIDYTNKMIFSDKSLNINSFDDVYITINQIFKNKRFVTKLNNVKINWLDVSLSDVIDTILNYIQSFESITVS